MPWAGVAAVAARAAVVRHRVEVAGPARLAATAGDAASADADAVAARDAVDRARGAADDEAAAALNAATADRNAAVANQRAAVKTAKSAAAAADRAAAAAAAAATELQDAVAAATAARGGDGGAAERARLAAAEGDAQAAGQRAALADAACRDADADAAAAAAAERTAADVAATADRAARQATDAVAALRRAGDPPARAAMFGPPSLPAVAAAAATPRAALPHTKRSLRAPAYGPLGALITARDAGAVAPLAAVIGPLAASFLAATPHDAATLRTELAAAGAGSTRVFVVAMGAAPYAPPRLRAASRTLLDAVAVDGPPACRDAVRNLLIDIGAVERIVLAANAREARAAVAPPERGGEGDRGGGVAAAVTPDGSRYARRGATVTVHPPPTHAHIVKFKSGRASPAEMKAAAAEAERAQTAATERAAAAAAARDASAAARRDARAAHDAARRAAADRDAAIARVEALRGAAADAVGATRGGSGDLAGLRAAADAAASAAADKRAAADDAAAAAEDAAASARDAGERVEAAKTAAAARAGDRGELAAAAAAAADRATAAAAMVARVTERLAKYRADLARLESEAGDMARLAESVCARADGDAALARLKATPAFRDARKRGPGEADDDHADHADRLAAAATAAEADAGAVATLHRRARAALAAGERDAGGTLAELQAELDAAAPAAAAALARVRAHGELARQMARGLAAREAAFVRVRHRVEEAVGTRFRTYMRRKGHVGAVRVDWEARTLDLSVGVAGGGGGTGGGRATGQPRTRDLRALSGGERSFTTVAFALALGEFTHCPFRALDEFDVYMDAVNRRVSLASLLGAADAAPGLQFLLLTPQDVAAVDAAAAELERSRGTPLPAGFVRVLTMPPPARPPDGG